MRTYSSLRHLATALAVLALVFSHTACNTTGGGGGNGGASGAASGDAGNRAEDTESAERMAKESKDAGAFTEVLIETFNGSVDVAGTDSNTTVDVEARITAMGPTQAEAARRVNAIQLVAEADPDTPSRLHVRVEFPGGSPPLTQTGDVTVVIPKTLKVIVRAGNTAVTVRNAGKDVKIKTNKQSITCTDIGGSVEATTQEADIRCYRVGGNCLLTTAKGDIDVQYFGGSIKLKTSYGDINILHDHVTTPIKIANPIEIEAETEAKSITCKIPGDVPAALTLAAPNGEVQADDLDEDMDIADGAVRTSDQQILKVNGGGEGQIELRANNGRVVFRIHEFTKPANKGN